MDKKYLFKRHKTWWVKVAVPRTLRAKLGFDLRESLKTQDLEKAQKLKWKLVEKLKNKIKEAKDESLKNVVDYLHSFKKNVFDQLKIPQKKKIMHF